MGDRLVSILAYVRKNVNTNWTVGYSEILTMYFAHHFQLEDEGLGGMTVFPSVGVAARPIKGSVVTWFNIRGDEAPDDLSWHGACPMLFGRRAIAETSVYVYDQFLSYPCHTDRERPYKIFETPDSSRGKT